MQDAEIVMIGGGPLGKEVGDHIVEQGVRLASVWGSCVYLTCLSADIIDASVL
jgi:hypothetical protein